MNFKEIYAKNLLHKISLLTHASGIFYPGGNAGY